MPQIAQHNDPHFRERYWVRWAKFTVDILALQISLFLGWYLRKALTPWFPLDILRQHFFNLSIGMLLIPVGYWLVRLYPGYGLSTVERLRRRVRATFVFFMAFITWDFLLNHYTRPRGILIAAFGVALILPPIIQVAFRKILIHLNLWGTPVIILGAGMTGEHVVRTLEKDTELGFKPIAILDDDSTKWGTDIAGIPISGGLHKASEYIDKVHCVMLAIPGAGRERLIELVRHLPFFNVIIIPDLIGLQSLWVETRDLGGIIGLEIQKNLLLRRNIYLKRLMDYLLGVPLFLMSLPILAAFAIWIMVISPGNPIYCQIREGRGGRKFKVWKLRTMHHHAEKLLHDYLASNPEAKVEWHQFFKLRQDPRILPVVGNLLRKTSLDELPQFWNVLSGEMSLVGPRPFPHYHLEQFNDDFRRMRRSVMPGITGLWQVTARSEGNLTVQENLDSYYIRNWSIWLDLYLLAKTILVVVRGKGAY